MNRRAAGLFSVAMSAAIGVLGGGVAHADATDSSFLHALDQDGVTYQDPARIINYAKAVCDALHSGRPAAELVNRIQSENPKLTQQGARYFVADAVAHYCPELNTAKP
ncbi:DUF732 domain-containing protein [Mycobacterium heckeshornense]|uniref:Uncharacterized protein n=1 Tax=Mycobacterium heckeshornense TaxID=110505 RepID=A0A7R7YRT5_9MYCO|nr:DUF732 domain-containing protein [Mycobacterium heckeshornense]MCV7034155.1 DUF732 domain-containing protein [Mycobacterium heckeshornense]BCO34699.1 hypothetical protein MHEC_11320 [Mycobacterium heckeshornense]BCQ07873.1 hypothetical protein JMUB5695_01297 [Mycobacterium heckeshornense]